LAVATGSDAISTRAVSARTMIESLAASDQWTWPCQNSIRSQPWPRPLTSATMHRDQPLNSPRDSSLQCPARGGKGAARSGRRIDGYAPRLRAGCARLRRSRCALADRPARAPVFRGQDLPRPRASCSSFALPGARNKAQECADVSALRLTKCAKSRRRS
jgi:hypothetical protein